MGMTDKQFDAYVKAQLRLLEKAKKKLVKKGVSSEDLEDLEEIIKDMRDQLSRP